MELEFPNHAGMRITYPLSISLNGRTTTYTAQGDPRQKYTAYVEKANDGWVAMEVSDTGSGAVIAD